jgi:hypothetical protein
MIAGGVDNVLESSLLAQVCSQRKRLTKRCAAFWPRKISRTVRTAKNHSKSMACGCAQISGRAGKSLVPRRLKARVRISFTDLSTVFVDSLETPDDPKDWARNLK